MKFLPTKTKNVPQETLPNKSQEWITIMGRSYAARLTQDIQSSKHEKIISVCFLHEVGSHRGQLTFQTLMGGFAWSAVALTSGP